MNFRGKLVKLYLSSGREVQGHLKELLTPVNQDTWQLYQEEVVLQDHSQEIRIRPDRIEGYVIL
jgi:hypothetical protein